MDWKELGLYILKEAEEWAKERRLNELKYNADSCKGNVFEEYSEYYRAKAQGDVEGMLDAMADSLIYIAVDLTKNFETEADKRELEEYFAIELQNNVKEAEELGYDFKKVMGEVFKEINSRTGAWSDELGKWKKFETDEAKAKWYKANMKNAKIS